MVYVQVHTPSHKINHNSQSITHIFQPESMGLPNSPSGEYRVISIRAILFYLFIWITCSASTISALTGCYPLSIVCPSSSTILVSGAPRHDTFFPSCFMSMCNPLGYDRPALRSRHTFFQPGLKPPYFYHFRTSSPQFLCGPLGFPSCVI